MNAHTLTIAAGDLWHNGRAALHNLRCRMRPADVDYILIGLSGKLPEYIPPPPPWQKWVPFPLPTLPSGWSLSSLRSAFEQIALDPRPLGVILQLNGLNIGWATAQSLRDAIGRLREKGKKVIAYSAYYDVVHYYVATAADLILAPRSAMWDVAGLRTEVTFLKDAFAAWGVEAEVVNVSPYKTAWDAFARSHISPEHKAMLDWIMDGRFEALVGAIASARTHGVPSGKLDPARVRELIDSAPLTAEAAQSSCLIDGVLYEDELAEYLAPEKKARQEERRSRGQIKWPFRTKRRDGFHANQKPRASIKRWNAVWWALRRPIRWRSGKRVAVIPLEGAIIPGKSPQVPPIPPLPIPLPLPFVDEPIAGAETIAQHFRDAERDESIAAIVFHVNSRGGSAIASDLIWREVDRVRRKKPVVVAMGDFAASGGYYVSAPAGHILAQPLTITGSIGVISLKIVTAGLYEKLKANRVVLKRGANAGLYADDSPFTPEMRAVAKAQTDAYYGDFKKVVMTGRRLDEASLEPVAGGRVWLGQQALAHKLVDAMGGVYEAIEKAKELAKLPATRYTPTVWYGGSGGNLLAPPFPSTPSAADEYARLIRTMFREHIWMIAPFNFQ